MRPKSLFLMIAVSFAILASNVLAQKSTENADLGFDVNVNAYVPKDTGIPIIRSMTVTKIRDGSSASTTSLAVGDEIMEVNGFVIPGSKIPDAWAVKQKITPMQKVIFKIKKPDGRSQTIDVISAPVTQA